MCISSDGAMEKGHGLWGPWWSLCGAAAGPGNIGGRGGPCLSQASSYPTPWPGAGPGALVTAPLPPSCPPVPSAPPRKVEAEALNATAIRVLWRSPTPGRQHGQIRGYQVHYVRMEGAEARGPLRIKDIMLADAQVGRHGWGGRGAWALSPLCSPLRCWLPSHFPPLSPSTASRSVGDGRHCRICK